MVTALTIEADSPAINANAHNKAIITISFMVLPFGKNSRGFKRNCSCVALRVVLVLRQVLLCQSFSF